MPSHLQGAHSFHFSTRRFYPWKLRWQFKAREVSIGASLQINCCNMFFCLLGWTSRNSGRLGISTVCGSPSSKWTLLKIVHGSLRPVFSLWQAGYNLLLCVCGKAHSLNICSHQIYQKTEYFFERGRRGGCPQGTHSDPFVYLCLASLKSTYFNISKTKPVWGYYYFLSPDFSSFSCLERLFQH